MNTPSSTRGARCARGAYARACGWLALVLLVVAPCAAAQGTSPFRIGLHVQGNASLQPGLEVSYQPPGMVRGHARFIASYSTTRLETALGRHELVKDRFQIGAAWFFRPQRRIDPYVQLDLGYERFDREDEELFALLDNTAGIVSVLTGLEARFMDDALGARGGVGLSLLQSSTVYPFVYSVGLNYKL